MVSDNSEQAPLDVVAKVFYREEDGWELVVESTVFPLRISELLREES